MVILNNPFIKKNHHPNSPPPPYCWRCHIICSNDELWAWAAIGGEGGDLRKHHIIMTLPIVSNQIVGGIYFVENPPPPRHACPQYLRNRLLTLTPPQYVDRIATHGYGACMTAWTDFYSVPI